MRTDGFAAGDTVVVQYGGIDTVSCGTSGRYPRFVGASLRSRNGFDFGCGDIVVQGGCAIFYGWDFTHQSIRLVDCGSGDLCGYSVIGDLLWECDPSNPAKRTSA